MHRTVAIQVKDIVLAPPLAATMQNVVGQLPQPHRRRTPSMPNILRSGWPTRIFRSSRSVEMNWLRIGCILLDEAVQRGFLAHNPAEGTRGFKTGDDESPHRALKREETKALLDAIDRRMSIDKRDYALIMLLLRTGIRRAEAVALTIGDLVMEQGYHAAIIEHGKGNKLSLAKFLVEVRQVIDEYLVAAGREHVVPGAPLFVSFRKGDHPQERPLHPNQVERIVKQRAQAVGIVMSPHGMRASFITLAFEGGADLALVQDGARHKDPRTTRRYQKRRNSLHKNAVDFVWIE